MTLLLFLPSFMFLSVSCANIKAVEIILNENRIKKTEKIINSIFHSMLFMIVDYSMKMSKKLHKFKKNRPLANKDII